MFKFNLRIFMLKLKRDTLPVNLKPYFTNIIKIHSHLAKFSEANYFFLE